MQQARFALLKRIALALDAAAVVTPSGLVALAAQQRFVNLTEGKFKNLKLQLLCQISEALA